MIVATPKNILSAKQKELLTKKGYVVIECDDPSKIRVITPETVMDANDLFLSALKGLRSNCPTSKQEIFVEELYNRLSKQTNHQHQ